MKGSPSNSGPDGASRRSAGSRSRSAGTGEPTPPSPPSQPSSSPTFHRIAQSVRAATENPFSGGSPEVNCRTRRGKSSGSPGVGSAHTSSSRKSRVSSWTRHGREVCVLFGSLMGDLHPWPGLVGGPWRDQRVVRFDHVEAAEDLLRVGERAVRGQRLTVLDADGRPVSTTFGSLPTAKYSPKTASRPSSESLSSMPAGRRSAVRTSCSPPRWSLLTP